MVSNIYKARNRACEPRVGRAMMTVPTETPKTRRPLWRRALSALLTLGGTAVTAGIAVVAVIALSGLIAARSGADESDAPRDPLPVTVAVIDVQDSYVVQQQFTGQIEPRRKADLGFEAGGTIEKIAVDEGEIVVEGDVLARLDTRALDAQLAQQRAAREALEAQLELAELTSRRQDELAERNFASQQRADETRLLVSELQARLTEMDAAITGVEIQLDKAVLRAPFAGEIARRYLDEGARTGPATPVIEVLETAAPQLRIGLSPDVAARLELGEPLDVAVAGAPMQAVPINRRRDIDPITRTVPVLFEISGDGVDALVYGAVVRLSVEREVEGRGTWVPLAALSEGPRGLWTLYTVTDHAGDTITARESVEIVYADEQRAYVRGGLDDGMRIVTEGPHRLAPGQRVTPSFAEG